MLLSLTKEAPEPNFSISLVFIKYTLHSGASYIVIADEKR